MRYAFNPLVAYQYFATPENDWQALFHQYIPHWRVVRDENAIKSFYEGISSGESIPWGAWLIPLFAWTLYVFVLYFVVICLSVLLRRQWVEIERCSFPLVVLPVEMANNPPRSEKFTLQEQRIMDRICRSPMHSHVERPSCVLPCHAGISRPIQSPPLLNGKALECTETFATQLVFFDSGVQLFTAA